MKLIFPWSSIFLLGLLSGTEISRADNSTDLSSSTSVASTVGTAEKTVPVISTGHDSPSKTASATTSTVSVAPVKTTPASLIQPVSPGAEATLDLQRHEVELELAAAEKTLADQQAQSKHDGDDAQRIASEELAQAQAMADATIAAQSAAGGSQAGQAMNAGTDTSFNAPPSAVRHYAMAGLVAAPHGIGADPTDAGHHSMGALVSSSHALGPDPSDAKHHSMSNLIDNP